MDAESIRCVFCKLILDGDYAAGDTKSVVVEPLNPVVPGHLLVIPRKHVPDFATDPKVSAETMRSAAELVHHLGGEYNLITSKGSVATQTVFHLHLHLVPRQEGDGLYLPWTNQEK